MGAYVPMLIMGGAAAGLANVAASLYKNRDNGIQSSQQIANQFNSLTPATPVAPNLPGAPPPPPTAPTVPQLPDVPSVPVVDLNKSPDTLLSSSLDSLVNTRRKNDQENVDRYRALTAVWSDKNRSNNTLLGQ